MTNKIAVIIEGVRSEPQLIFNLIKNFFDCDRVTPIYLYPSCTNIYALWCQMKKDDFETDIIELVKEQYQKQLRQNRNVKKVNNLWGEDYTLLNRDDFSEIYLFFDYEGHNHNLPLGVTSNEIMEQMLQTFDNETENGKLYVSYPMIEAIRHFTTFSLCEGNACFVPISVGKGYKELVSKESCVMINAITKEHWIFILRKFMKTVNCLFRENERMLIHEIKKDVNPLSIYQHQYQYFITKGNVMICSGFSEFILDYFKTEILEQRLECNIRLFEENEKVHLDLL